MDCQAEDIYWNIIFFFQCCLVKWPGFWITSWVSVPTFLTWVVLPPSSGCLKSVKKWWSFMKELQVFLFFKINIFIQKIPHGSWLRKLSFKIRFWPFLITIYVHLTKCSFWYIVKLASLWKAFLRSIEMLQFFSTKKVKNVFWY